MCELHVTTDFNKLFLRKKKFVRQLQIKILTRYLMILKNYC